MFVIASYFWNNLSANVTICFIVFFFYNNLSFCYWKCIKWKIILKIEEQQSQINQLETEITVNDNPINIVETDGKCLTNFQYQLKIGYKYECFVKLMCEWEQSASEVQENIVHQSELVVCAVIVLHECIGGVSLRVHNI